MSNLKPHKFDVQVIYKCPNCKFEHWKMLKEVSRPNAAIHCYCGKSSEIQQMVNPQILPNYSGSEKVGVEVKAERPFSSDDMSRAISMLAAQGYSGSEIKTMTAKALFKNPKTIGEIVRFSIAEYGG